MNYKQIDGYENYLITKEGSVYNTKTKKFLNPCKNGQGYLNVCLYENGKPKYFLVHRLVAEAFIENPNNLPFCDHILNNKLDNRIENLRWVTASDNSKNKQMGNTEFIYELSQSCFSFEVYNNHQFKNYFIDENLQIYQKITNNKYKLMKLYDNRYRIYDENNQKISISISKLRQLYDLILQWN